MSMVLDCSVTLAWVYRDEITPAVSHVFDRLRLARGAWVPGLWRLEVGNALLAGIRRKRHGADFRDATLVDLSQLPIQVDPETDSMHGIECHNSPFANNLRPTMRLTCN